MAEEQPGAETQERFSPDGNWWWNGSQWVPATQAPVPPSHIATTAAPDSKSMPAYGPTGDVQIWAQDLAAGNLPRVSPISGEPGTVAVKYKYRTAPPWAILLILGGILVGVGWIPGIIIMLAVSKKASGSFYLTPKEKQRVQIMRALPVILLLATFALFVLSFALSSNQDAPTGLIILLALLCFIAFIVTLLIVSPRVRPRAKVIEMTPGTNVVQLRGVNPAFVAALNQMYVARATPKA